MTGKEWESFGEQVRQHLGTPTADSRARLYFAVEGAVRRALHERYPLNYEIAHAACARGDGELMRRLRMGEYPVEAVLVSYFNARPVPSRPRTAKWVGPGDAMTWDQLLAHAYADDDPIIGLTRVAENERRHLTDAVVDYFYRQALAVSGL